ncbi:hypothetical protein EVAR_10460_1 [Eumeta japonica]|uniref:Uncharacterized protein n=1 Tax=Eumeta variegata TaxID=151549 RepID=A0A4C1TH97_EUMVA|nr:hypothetical protein EVAR_10460_1 [Eumeta japonica]
MIAFKYWVRLFLQIDLEISNFQRLSLFFGTRRTENAGTDETGISFPRFSKGLLRRDRDEIDCESFTRMGYVCMMYAAQSDRTCEEGPRSGNDIWDETSAAIPYLTGVKFSVFSRNLRI